MSGKPFTLILITVFILLSGTTVNAETTSQEALDAGRPVLFDGTLSGIRQAYDIFDIAVSNPECVDCAGSRELLFFHALSRIAMWAVRDDGGPVNSGMELANELGTEITGDFMREIIVTEPNFPENRYGQPAIPANAHDLLNNLLTFLDESAIPDIEDVINELHQINETPEDRFRVFLTPAETAAFLDPLSPPYTHDIEVDYGEVLLLKGALSIIKGMVTTKSAYDTHVDAQDRLLEKFHEDNFSIRNDLLLPHPDFMKLLPTANDPNDGAAIMAQSRQDIIIGMQYYSDMIDYILSEDVPAGTDPQDNELLSLDPNDIYISDALQDNLNTVIASLQSDTSVTIDGKSTKIYSLENSETDTLELLLEIHPTGKYQNGELQIHDNGFNHFYGEVDFEIIGNQISGYADDYGYYGYFSGTFNQDRTMITNASFEYWGLAEGFVSDLSGALVSEYLEEQWTADANPVFGDSPRYPDPVSPRELICDFSDWNKPLPGTLPDVTLGGILPDATDMDWTNWINPQPDTKIAYWPEVYAWQKIGGFIGVWLQEQLLFTDKIQDLGEGWIPEGTDIKELYMGYDDDYLHGCIVLNYTPVNGYYYEYEVCLSYCPKRPGAIDSLKIKFFENDEYTYGELYQRFDDFGYHYWDHVASVEVQRQADCITYRIPFDDIPVFISGRYISVQSSWGYYSWMQETTDENNTHIQVGMTGSISGTVNFPGHRGGPIFVQAYSNWDDPEGSLVAYTMLTEPGEFMLENIGLGFAGYVRAFSPLFGDYHLADMDAQKAKDIETVLMYTQNVWGVELNLDVPPVLQVNTWTSDAIDGDENREDYFAFDAIAGVWHAIELNRISTGYMRMTLLDRNGYDELIELQDWQPQYISWLPTVNGRYYIKVSEPEWTQTGGSYEIKYNNGWYYCPDSDISGRQWAGVKDCQVDMLDFIQLSNYWLEDCSAPYWCEESDYDKNGIVDLDDLSTLLNRWMEIGYGTE